MQSTAVKKGSPPLTAHRRTATIQPKLMVNAPGDRYEQEADAMADQVMRMPQNQPTTPVRPAATGMIARSIQRKCAACEAGGKTCSSCAEEENKKKLMRKAEGGGGGFAASPGLVSQLGATRGGGSPLPSGTRSFMENAFSTDFSGVRVHTDGRAAEMSRGIQAKAFTYGSDIYFNGGEFAPESDGGKRLLAHELGHVVQQGGILSNIYRNCDPTISSCLDDSSNSSMASTNTSSSHSQDDDFNLVFNQHPNNQPSIDSLPHVDSSERAILLQVEFLPTLELLFSDFMESVKSLRRYDQNTLGTGPGIGMFPGITYGARRHWNITSMGSRSGHTDQINESESQLNQVMHLVGINDKNQISQIHDNFISMFREKAKVIAFFMLDQSEKVTQEEYERYTNMPVDSCPSVLPELKDSIQRLASFQVGLVNLMNDTAEIFNRDAPWGYPQGPTNITANDYYKYLDGSVFSSDRAVQEQLFNFNSAIREEGLTFPVLLKEHLNYIELGYQMNDEQLKKTIIGHAVDVLNNIRKSRSEIDNDNIWDLTPVIQKVQELLGINLNSNAMVILNKYLNDRARNKNILDIFLSAVGIILSLVAIFATGGLAAFAIIGGTAIGGYQTYKHWNQYQFEVAARGSAFDLNNSIGANFDPSGSLLAFDIAMTILNVAQAASALRGIRAASGMSDVVDSGLTIVQRSGANAASLSYGTNISRVANAQGFLAEEVSDDIVRITHPSLQGEFIVTPQSVGYKTPTGTGMRVEFEIPVSKSEFQNNRLLGDGLDEIDEAFNKLIKGELAEQQGTLFDDLFFYEQRQQALEELRRITGQALPSKPTRTPVGVQINPNPGYQAAHMAPQSPLRSLPQYDPGQMITKFLPTGKGHAHTVFDQYWQQEFRVIAQTTGRTTTTAQEVAEVVGRAARQSGAFSPAEAESISQLVIGDLFFQLGLSPNQVLRMPGL